MSDADVFQFEMETYTNVRANDISVWYQFPQYIIITAGEVLFSITGLSFAYTQVTQYVIAFHHSIATGNCASLCCMLFWSDLKVDFISCIQKV